MSFNTIAAKLREIARLRRLRNTFLHCFSRPESEPKQPTDTTTTPNEHINSQSTVPDSNPAPQNDESSNPAPQNDEEEVTPIKQHVYQTIPGVDIILSKQYDFEKIAGVDINSTSGDSTGDWNEYLSEDLSEVLSQDLSEDSWELEVEGWRKGKQVGEGGCGEVFMATHIETGEEAIMKTESQSVPYPTLCTEIEVYKALQQSPVAAVGFPKMHCHGTIGGLNFIVIDRLGEDLEHVQRFSEHRPRASVILSYGIQALARIKSLHLLGHIHGDVKPENFMLGRSDPERLYLIDFGFSARFLDENGDHIACDLVEIPKGTTDFASLEVNWGCPSSRRDDLISLGYSIIYLFERELPWESVTASEVSCLPYDVALCKEDYVVGDSLRDFCQSLPVMEQFFEYVFSLEFEEEPNYRYLTEVLCSGLNGSDESST